MKLSLLFPILVVCTLPSVRQLGEVEADKLSDQLAKLLAVLVVRIQSCLLRHL